MTDTPKTQHVHAEPDYDAIVTMVTGKTHEKSIVVNRSFCRNLRNNLQALARFLEGSGYINKAEWQRQNDALLKVLKDFKNPEPSRVLEGQEQEIISLEQQLAASQERVRALETLVESGKSILQNIFHDENNGWEASPETISNAVAFVNIATALLASIPPSEKKD